MSASRNAVNEKPWDRERIKAELRRKGFTLAALDRKHKYAPGHFSHALIQPMRKAERIIADILGVEPSTLWPARYGSDGRPHQGRFLPDAQPCANVAARQDLKDAS